MAFYSEIKIVTSEIKIVTIFLNISDALVLTIKDCTSNQLKTVPQSELDQVPLQIDACIRTNSKFNVLSLTFWQMVMKQGTQVFKFTSLTANVQYDVYYMFYL